MKFTVRNCLFLYFSTNQSFYAISVLTPVNEYKMSEKIQSANNLLFASSVTEHEPLQMSTTSPTRMNEMKLQSKHRVTFSSDIEEYDDEEAVVAIDEIEVPGHENEDEIEEIVDAFELVEQQQLAIEEIDANTDESSNETVIIRQVENTAQQPDEAEAVVELPEKIEGSVSEEKKPGPKKPSKAQIASNLEIDPKVRAQQHQLLKIHLNVRKCCELRYLENDRLPRYNGYISQYGLSKDQLDDLERNRRLNRQHMNEKRKRFREEVAQRSAENEQAFARWLYHKQKTAKSRTKNMYDSK